MAGSRTAVVCDTTAYLPPELVDRYGVELVSLYVTLEGREQREAELDDYDDFYERLRTADQPATTSQPSVGDFIEVYEPLLADGRDVVSIHISGGISGTTEAARQAKATLESDGKGGERVHVVDTETTAGGQGIVALATAAAAQAGGDANAVVERARATRKALKMWFAVDTLEYLRRGGRIGAASALIGSTFRIKPILTFEQEIQPVEKVRTSARAFERLVEYARQRHEAGADAWVVQHIQDPETADRLAEECRGVFGRDPLFVSEVGPVLGAHAGPGMLGVGSVPVELF